MKAALFILTSLISHIVYLEGGQPALKKCKVYKVIHGQEKLSDSILSQEILFNDKLEPLLEVNYLEDGKSIQNSIKYEYKKGKLVSRTLIEDSIEKEKTTFTYYSSGKEAKTCIYVDGKIQACQEFLYNGTQIKEIRSFEYSGKNPSLNSMEKRFYDKSNRIIKTTITNSNGDTTFKGIFLYEGDNNFSYTAYGSDKRVLESYKSYFSKKNIIKKEFYKNNKASTKILYKYDDSGRMINKQVINIQGKTTQIDEFVYGSTGRLKTSIIIDNDDETKNISSYNEQGQKLIEELWQEGRIKMKLVYHYFL